MKKEKIIKNLQEIINDEFDKFLRVKFGDDTYSIAITKDQVPQVLNINFANNTLIIEIKSDMNFQYDNELIKIISNKNGNVIKYIISNFADIKGQNPMHKLAKEISNEYSDDNRKIISNNKQSRILNAIEKFLNIDNNIENYAL